jgi:hypothetical protein
MDSKELLLLLGLLLEILKDLITWLQSDPEPPDSAELMGVWLTLNCFLVGQP